MFEYSRRETYTTSMPRFMTQLLKLRDFGLFRTASCGKKPFRSKKPLLLLKFRESVKKALPTN